MEKHEVYVPLLRGYVIVENHGYPSLIPSFKDASSDEQQARKVYGCEKILRISGDLLDN